MPSFVQKAKDLNDLKKYVGNQTGIMAKFENLAIKNMNEILQYCDAAMVARGDLVLKCLQRKFLLYKKNSAIMQRFWNSSRCRYPDA